jgi:hypothetical protein
VSLRQQWIIIAVGWAWLVGELVLAASIMLWFRRSP